MNICAYMLAVGLKKSLENKANHELPNSALFLCILERSLSASKYSCATDESTLAAKNRCKPEEFREIRMPNG